MTGGLAALSAEWVATGYAPVLFAGLVLAGIGTITLFCVGLLAYYRRRSTRYLLVTLALGALVVRTIVGWGTAVGAVPMIAHHLADHGLDFFVAVDVLYLVYRSRNDPDESSVG
ncbi:MAG: hypothetical protein ABEJ23_02065 [Haloarculaceae archaeon]